MISVGIDVSKGKSTVCILKPYGEIVCSHMTVERYVSDNSMPDKDKDFMDIGRLT